MSDDLSIRAREVAGGLRESLSRSRKTQSDDLLIAEAAALLDQLTERAERAERELAEAHTKIEHWKVEEQTWKEEMDALVALIENIDAHATPYGDIPGEPGWVGTYLVTAGSLHKALGKVGHSAPSCEAEALLDEIAEASWAFQDAAMDYVADLHQHNNNPLVYQRYYDANVNIARLRGKGGNRRMSERGIISAEEPQQCDLCGVSAELRPYGPNGEKVCFRVRDEGRTPPQRRSSSSMSWETPMPTDYLALADRVAKWGNEVNAALNDGGYAAGDSPFFDPDDALAAASAIRELVAENKALTEKIERLEALLDEIEAWNDDFPPDTEVPLVFILAKRKETP